MNETEEHYTLLLALAQDPTLGVADGGRAAYGQLRQLLEGLCRTQTAGTGLQLTDLSARIGYASRRWRLSGAEVNRLHTVRLTSNDVLNHRTRADSRMLMRDIKTLACLVSKVSGVDTPEALRRLLPTTDDDAVDRPPAPGNRVKRMRMTFVEADTQAGLLYMRPTDRLTREPMRVRYGVEGVNDEFNPTCQRLWQGAQVNLLDVAVDQDGTLTPQIMVLEPDYLLDVSSLAECFREFGHHPVNYILARLQPPSERTRPLLLGNIANLFLDEWVNSPTPPAYLDCMRKAFRTYPVELAACEELHDPAQERDFFNDCQRHFDHIGQVVTETFHAPGYELDPQDALIEPSYICEPLGLQGRLDYMQRDISALIEMKSGKADEYALRGHIVPKENHRVQMQLYQAMLEYTMGRDHRHVKAYLLYTRYPLLYSARPSWALLRRAIDLRNRIVATEYGIQLHGSTAFAARCLADLQPNVLNENERNDRLWRDYLCPQISDVTQRLENLTPLERSYFYTLYIFITRELYTAKSGDAGREGRKGMASLWLSTLEEKREAGEILYDLRMVENAADDANCPQVTLSIPPVDATAGQPNFRQGDAVVLYERRSTQDNVTRRMVFKGTIRRVSLTTLCVRLRYPQHNAQALPADSRYAVEHDAMDTGFRTMYAGLAAFLHANPDRRDLLLGQRPPRRNRALDEAVAAAHDDFERATLKAQAARDYFLLVGPPGTGKTSRALRAMVEAFLSERRQMLLLSYTNRAVDEICRMLTSITPKVDFIRMGSELACDQDYRPYLLEHALADCTNRKQVKERIQACQVFVGTVATMAMRTDLFKLKTFDVAIVDEATQILEPQLLGLLCMRGRDGQDVIGKFVLVGDHHQLPAVVVQTEEQSAVTDEGLRAIGLLNLKDSLFERLYRSARKVGGEQLSAVVVDTSGGAGPLKTTTEEEPDATALGQTTQAGHQRPTATQRPAHTDTDERPNADHQRPTAAPTASADLTRNPFVDMLHRQARMHEKVARFPGQAFYGGRLVPLGLPHQHGPLTVAPELEQTEWAPLLRRRVAFLPSVPEPPTHSPKSNADEATKAAQLSAAICRQYVATTGFDPNQTLGIIAPYRSQVAAIRRQLEATGVEALLQVMVDTVERFQGSEREVIIYSFCVNRPSQLSLMNNLVEDEGAWIDRKLNVALTRARSQLFLIGVPQLLALNPIYARLLDDLTKGGNGTGVD